jgi:hypothetical protein
MWDIIGDAAGEHQARLRRVLTAKETPAVEITALLPTRTEFGFWIHKIFPVRGRSGKITQIGSLAVEVTDSRKLEDRFRRLAAQPLWSEKDYQGLSKELHDSINAYHRSIAMNLNRLSQQVDEPERIPDVVAHSHGGARSTHGQACIDDCDVLFDLERAVRASRRCGG